jgi:hypothetical protein
MVASAILEGHAAGAGATGATALTLTPGMSAFSA